MTSYIRYLLAGLCLIGLACPHLLAQSCPSASITSARAQSGSNFSLVKVASELKNPDSDLVLVTAHRGYWEYCPENTIEAFQAAIDTGIEAVEMDVRLSAAGSDKAGKSFSNGEVFLTHDYDLRGEAPGTVGSQQNNLIYTLTPAQLQSRTMVDRRGNNATDDSGAALTFHTFTDLLSVQGITLQNSPKFQITLHRVNGGDISNVTINTPTSSHAAAGPAYNTDGIDPIASSNITISNVNITSGDDNIAIKSDSTGPSQNISIQNSNFFAPGHGLSIGSQTNGGINNIRASNINFQALIMASA